MDDAAAEQSDVVKLPRGGVWVNTVVGPIQFGIPPETIKDSMILGLEVPNLYVVPTERFNRKIGPNEGVNLAEFEFPAYLNFFMRSKSVNLIVNSTEVRDRIRRVFQETLLGPLEIDPDVDFASNVPKSERPDLMKELGHFAKFGDKKMSIDMLLKFTVFDSDGRITLENPESGEKVEVVRALTEYLVFEGGVQIARVPAEVELPIPDTPPKPETVFRPPLFGVTVLGSSHGFDPKGSTSGYVLWINRRGVMIDPPTNSTNILLENNIPPSLIDGVIVTHCHADHDAGTFQKILQEGRVTLMTTPTIMGSFLRKYSALSGLNQEFLKGVFHFRPVRIGEYIKVRGGVFRFFYTLHSIPCVGFVCSFGGKSMVFSADHMNDADKIRELGEKGVLSEGRMNDLLKFPWHHDVILHEMGVPPIHTPYDTLVSLPADVKQRMFVVHVDPGKVKAGDGLTVAIPGVDNTIFVPVEPPPHSTAIEILDLVSSLDLFSSLTVAHAREILTIAKTETFGAGSRIIKQGDVGECFYIIMSGVAEVRVPRVEGSSVSARSSAKSKEGEAGEDNDDDDSSVGMVTVKTYTSGASFGEQALITEEKRSCDIVALTDVHVIRFNRTDFHWLLQGTGIFERMQHLAEMRKESIWETIACNSVLCMLTSQQKTQLEEYFDKREVKQNEQLWCRADSAKFAILVDEGAVRFDGNVKLYRRYSGVHVESGAPSQTVPPFFGRGAFVGDVDALVAGHVHNVGLTATCDGSVLVLNRADLLRFFSHNPGVLLSMLHTHFII